MIGMRRVTTRDSLSDIPERPSMSRPCRSCFSPVRHPHRGPWRQSATSMPTLWAPSRGFATFRRLRCWQCQEAVFPLRIVRPRRPGLPALWVSHLCYPSRLMLADEPVCSPFNQSHPRVSWLVRCGDDRRSLFSLGKPPRRPRATLENLSIPLKKQGLLAGGSCAATDNTSGQIR